MGRTYRTMQGREVDMDKLRSANELTPADLRFRIKQRNELLRKAKQPQIKITNQMSFQELYEISLGLFQLQ